MIHVKRPFFFEGLFLCILLLLLKGEATTFKTTAKTFTAK